MHDATSHEIGREPTPDDPGFEYDEFGMFDGNLSEFGLPRPARITVARTTATTPGGMVSALRWGEGPLRWVFLHGAAQNAHTWDTVMFAMAAGGPMPSALCIDLPGHGRSEHRADGRYDPRTNALTVAAVLDDWFGSEVAPVTVVGMSLGGLTATALAAARPDLVERLVVVDITPGVDRDKAAAIHAFIAGPQTFPSFDALLERTVEFNPTRAVESLRRGILHNAERLPGGGWAWRYDRREIAATEFPAVGELWQDVSATVCPVLLIRGGDSPVVDDADVAELLRRRPDAWVEVIPGAGHSVQGDRPLELVELLRATPPTHLHSVGEEGNPSVS